MKQAGVCLHGLQLNRGSVHGQIRAAGGEPREGVLVCGDSGNDIELFAVPGVRGCMVSNAHSELKRWCDDHASPNIFQVSPGLASARADFYSCTGLFELYQVKGFSHGGIQVTIYRSPSFPTICSTFLRQSV